MTRPTKLIIDLNALRHNYKRVKSLAPQSKVLAMVKADAYGHGQQQVAQALNEADGFGVEDVEHAVALRQAGVKQTILLLEGVFAAEELEAVQHYGLDIVIHNEHGLEMLLEYSLSRSVRVWIKINTGMNRLGFLPEALKAVYARLHSHKQVENIVLMTHFARSGGRDKTPTQNQIDCFQKAIQGLDRQISLSNSGGVCAWPQAHGDWVRPGIMLYGATPMEEQSATELGLIPVLTLSSTLMAIQHCKKGSAIGYGGRYICPEDMPIGVIPIGYGDGYPRSMPDGTPVWVDGKTLPLAGAVSMDRLTVDLRSHPKAQIGSPAEAWGKHLSVDLVAKHAGTIGYELLTRMTSRPIRHYI